MKSRNMTRRCAVSLLGLLAAFAALGGARKGQEKEMVSSWGLRAALPQEKDLPSFDSPRISSKLDAASGDSGRGRPAWANSFWIRAKQTADQVALMADVVVAASPEEAIKTAETAMRGQAAQGPERRTISGRRIGQQVWVSVGRNPGSDKPAQALKMITTDGRSFVHVQMMLQVKGRVNGRAVAAEFTADDLRLAEDIAAQMLDRLTAMGLTSRPAASAPEWAKKQVAERRAALQRTRAASSE